MGDYLHSGANAGGVPPPDPCLDQAWKCKRCSALLGYGMELEGKTYLRIRYKDFYVKVVEPEVITVLCRRCSFDNTLNQVTQAGERPSPTTNGAASATTPAPVPSSKESGAASPPRQDREIRSQ